MPNHISIPQEMGYNGIWLGKARQNTEVQFLRQFIAVEIIVIRFGHYHVTTNQPMSAGVRIN